MNLKVSDAKREEGFTLIELLVVVIIIGILAAIAIPVFLNQRERAWVRTAQSDARNSAIEVESFFNDFFVYPDAVDATASTGTPLDGGADGDVFTDVLVFDLAGTDEAGPSGDIVVSPNVNLNVYTNGTLTEAATGYCVEAWHDLIVQDGADAPDALYNSLTGGIVTDQADVELGCAGQDATFGTTVVQGPNNL